MRTLIGDVRTDGLFTPATTEIWLKTTPNLLERPAVLVGKTTCLPADVERLLRRRSELDEAVLEWAGRSLKGPRQRLRRTATPV